MNNVLKILRDLRKNCLMYPYVLKKIDEAIEALENSTVCGNCLWNQKGFNYDICRSCIRRAKDNFETADGNK